VSILGPFGSKENRSVIPEPARIEGGLRWINSFISYLGTKFSSFHFISFRLEITEQDLKMNEFL
jgi:hypothetical protein